MKQRVGSPTCFFIVIVGKVHSGIKLNHYGLVIRNTKLVSIFTNSSGVPCCEKNHLLMYFYTKKQEQQRFVYNLKASRILVSLLTDKICRWTKIPISLNTCIRTRAGPVWNLVSDRISFQYYCGIIGIGILGTHVYGYPCVGIRSSVFSVYGVRYMV